MSFEYLVDPEQGPQWKGVLPGRPAPYALRRGEGEHAMLFTDVFTVLLSGDATDGQLGVITADCPPGRLIPTHAHNGTHETAHGRGGRVTAPTGLRDRQAPPCPTACRWTAGSAAPTHPTPASPS